MNSFPFHYKTLAYCDRSRFPSPIDQTGIWAKLIEYPCSLGARSRSYCVDDKHLINKFLIIRYQTCARYLKILMDYN